MSLFFESNERERDGEHAPLEEVGMALMFKCTGTNGCGRNIPAENIRGTTIRCDNCGKVYSTVQISYPGKVG